jgi:hypothetical protein
MSKETLIWIAVVAGVVVVIWWLFGAKSTPLPSGTSTPGATTPANASGYTYPSSSGA